jgi:predicted transcriptional regulator
MKLRNVRAKLLSRAGWSQKRIGEEVGLTQKAVGNLLSSFTDDPRNYYDLIDEAAAPYDDDVLAVAEAWKKYPKR